MFGLSLSRKKGELRDKLLKLVGPIFLEILLMLMLGVVDTLMLSHYSDNAVAAVGVVNQLLNMVFLLFNITTVGTSVMCALYFGAKDSKSFIQVVGVSLPYAYGSLIHENCRRIWLLPGNKFYSFSCSPCCQ